MNLHGADNNFLSLAALFLGDLTQIKSMISKGNSKCSCFLHPEEFTPLKLEGGIRIFPELGKKKGKRINKAQTNTNTSWGEHDY